MMKKRAFTLVEVLVYLGLLAFFSLLVFAFYARIYGAAARQVQTSQACMREVVAVDVMVRDLMTASMRVGDWDVDTRVFVALTLDDHGFPGQRCVGYEVGRQGLIRREGAYDFGRRVWGENTASLVATNLRNVTFELVGGQGGQPVTGVCIRYQVEQKTGARQAEAWVALRNRVLS